MPLLETTSSIEALPRGETRSVVLPAEVWAVLQRGFGVPFAIVDAANGEILEPAADQPACDWSARSELCREVARRRRPEIIHDEDPLLVLAIPIGHGEDVAQVAVGTFVSRRLGPADDLASASAALGMRLTDATDWAARQTPWPADALLRMSDLVLAEIQSAGRIRNLEAKAESLSLNINSTYEEISLLHRLTQNLKLSKSDADLGRMALEWMEEVLPARGLAIQLLPAARQGAAIGSDARQEPLLLVHGDCPLDNAQFARLIEHLSREQGAGSGEQGAGSGEQRAKSGERRAESGEPGATSSYTPLPTSHSPLPTPGSPLPTPGSPLPAPRSLPSQPLVANRGVTERPDWPCPQVREIIAVPMAEGENVFGWMVALNHITGGEFGTVEASLLYSVATILGIHGGNIRLYQQQADLMAGIIRALTAAIDAKDQYTCGHSDRVARIAVRLAQELHCEGPAINTIYLAGLLHDIGKIGILDAVLRKPGKLTDEEFAHIKTHPEIGHRILHDITKLDNLLPVILHHHEAWNGAGYPQHLHGDQIPLPARIVAVADSYDAMGSDRPYRQGMPDEKIDAIFRQESGVQWDPAVVAAFFAARDDLRRIVQKERSTADASPLPLGEG